VASPGDERRRRRRRRRRSGKDSSTVDRIVDEEHEEAVVARRSEEGIKYITVLRPLELERVTLEPHASLTQSSCVVASPI
jgi:hypothetical protein